MAGGPWVGGGDGHPEQSRPLLPRPEHCQSLPPGSGAPDRLRSSPSLQLEVANCSHCPEGTNEVPGSVLAQDAFCSLQQPLQPGMEVPSPAPPPPPAKASYACATTVTSDPRKRGQGSGMPEGRCLDIFDLCDQFPTLLRSLRSCETIARLEAGDTHRPELPVWASCRMRCNCLFIILGPGRGPRSHLGG
jgi:hypothetical protein